MRLGIGLPTTLLPDLNRGLFLDWCRLADQAGFHVFGTIDRPMYDSWDPLTALAAAAAVTERVRLATTILQLPNRNETLVAKQAAVIDRLSGGRLDLGVGLGRDPEDYKLFSARWPKRGKKLERQVRKMRRVWRQAKKATPEQGQPGPAPMQKPLPPVWLGGYAPRAIERAVEIGDGYIFGAAGIDAMRDGVPKVRKMVEDAGKKKFTIAGIAYCAVGDDPTATLERASAPYRRYYGERAGNVAEKIHHGPADVIAQAVKEYEQTGIDILILFPEIPDVKQVEVIAEEVLPSYRVPAR